MGAEKVLGQDGKHAGGGGVCTCRLCLSWRIGHWPMRSVVCVTSGLIG